MRMSDKGFTVIELLISMAIAGVVLTGIYDLVVSSSKFYLAQNAIVSMQADGRAAMDFIARELRSACSSSVCSSPVISTTTATNDTITFDRVEDTGYSEAGNGATTLNDPRKAWQGGMFVPSSTSTYMVRIVSGRGAGQSVAIAQNTATQLTLSAAWGVIPDATSFYVITISKRFTRTSATDNVLRYRIGGTAANNNPLAENITSHSFTLPNATAITITLTARTPHIDPIKKQYRYYTLTENIRMRN
jgi:prepilin-type N-terminal cleavage/methylation domain-containing protein